jgi:hypothetical protein
MVNSFLTLVLGIALVSHGNCQQHVDIVGFTKRMYSALGTKTPVEVASDMKEEYDGFNQDGLLGEKLNSLYEMRLEDLHISVGHVGKMRELLDILQPSVEDFFDD